MAVPKYEEMMVPLLRRAAEIGEELNVATLMPLIAADFGLSAEDQQLRLPSGGQTYLANRCHWAKFYLSRAGLLEASRRGHFKITEEGRAFLRQSPQSLTRRDLMQFPKFAEWWNETPQKDIDPEVVQTSAEESATTPDELIDRSAKLLVSALEADILARVRTVDPSRFEQVVVDLLIKMGFGGGDPDMGKRLGRTGDGGIDGVIQEDALGLDAVYIQAKRYQEGSTIGAPALQAFVGSLVGHRATKGVFVASSSFTSQAKEYVRQIHQRVVLIDGEELARLLVRHGVGVREDRRVVIKKLDEDYFSE